MIRQIASTEKYAGQYVAFRSRDDDTILAAGMDPKEVFDRARKNGAEKSVIAFVPEKDAVLIY